MSDAAGWTLFVFWVASWAVGAWIGYRYKGRPLTGFLLAVVLSWLGVAITALLPRTAEAEVQHRMRRGAIDAEVARRQAGAEPWTGGSQGP